MRLSLSLNFTDFLHVFMDKCESRITVCVKIKPLYGKWFHITTVLPSERRKHPEHLFMGQPISSICSFIVYEK
jgi:hypothetical protein